MERAGSGVSAMKELVYPRVLLPALENHADKVAFFDGDYENTMAGHGERVLRLADAMRHELGLEPGDRFAVMALNSHQFLELYHAAFLGAGIVTPLNLRLAGAELAHIVRDSGARAVFVDVMFAEHLVARARRGAGRARPRARRADRGRRRRRTPTTWPTRTCWPPVEPVVPPEPEEDDPVVLMYTGGTTGLPKGVVLDQRSEMLNLYHAGIVLGLPEHRVYLHQTPMFHAASMTGVLGIPAVGATSVFMPMFEAGGVLDLIEDAGRQPDGDGADDDPRAAQPPRLPTRAAGTRSQVLTYGASPMPEALLTRLLDELPWVAAEPGLRDDRVLGRPDHPDRRGPSSAAATCCARPGRPVLGVRLSIQDPDGTHPGHRGDR